MITTRTHPENDFHKNKNRINQNTTKKDIFSNPVPDEMPKQPEIKNKFNCRKNIIDQIGIDPSAAQDPSGNLHCKGDKEKNGKHF